MKTTTRVPHGGYGMADGTILTREQVKQARIRYARKHGCFVRTVRPMTTMFRDAMREYAEATK